jgi:tRNA/tmRNA/rRNA uracil-C5-methylase (TrmA/RlmC/RlmD family)
MAKDIMEDTSLPLNKLIKEQDGKISICMTHYVFGIIGTPVEIQKPDSKEIHFTLAEPTGDAIIDQMNRIHRKIWEKTYLAGRVMVVTDSELEKMEIDTVTKTDSLQEALSIIEKEIDELNVK